MSALWLMHDGVGLTMKINGKKEACTEQRYEVTRADLPISCPTQSMRVWDAHPRVFLPIQETGRAVCPYCDAEFILIEDDHA